MRSFWEMIQLIEDAPPAAPGGAALPGGGPGGLPGMGGGMPPMGGLGGMGAPPMGGPGGGMGGPPAGGGMAAPTTQLMPNSVWDVLNKILDGKPIENKESKPAGQNAGNMLQSAPQQPLPQQPPVQQGIPPAGPPLT